MKFNFELFDLISLVTILVGLVATYWKIVSRLEITEMKVTNLEEDFVKHEAKFTKDIEYCHEKMNKKLDAIGQKQEDLLVQVTKLASKLEAIASKD